MKTNTLNCLMLSCFLYYTTYSVFTASVKGQVTQTQQQHRPICSCRRWEFQLKHRLGASLTLLPRRNMSKLTLLKSSTAGQIAELTSTINTLQQGSVSGSTYVRWGRNDCPNGTDLVYSGFTGGSDYREIGGAANYVCLSPDPQWGYYEDATTSGAYMYGAEYQLGDYHSNGGSRFLGSNVNDEDAPCAVCHSPRPVMLMIPGRIDCYTGWTREYTGYLMAGSHAYTSATEYVCVDKTVDVLIGGHPDMNGRLFYLTEGVCGSLKCPPYIQGREITCAVCTK